MSSYYLEKLLSKYLPKGGLYEASEHVGRQPATQQMIESAEWLVRESPLPSWGEIALLITLVRSNPEPPILKAITAVFARLKVEIRAQEALLERATAEIERLDGLMAPADEETGDGAAP